MLPAAAQPAPRPRWAEGTAGSEVEHYLRLLALDSTGRVLPSGARAYTTSQTAEVLRRNTAHPWAARFDAAEQPRPVQFTVLRPALRAIVNTAFPFGLNDGAVWAGRGLTTAVQGGVLLAAGPLRVRLEPIAFRAQNSAFRLFDNGPAARLRLNDPVTPTTIDAPQRFGTAAYQRVDLGNSEVRLDAFGVAVGVSNANEVWGPAITHPLVLGANAPGFLHAFVGTGRALPVGVGRVHGRVIAGRLDQSAWSPAADSLARRLASGAVASFLPGGPFRGLELGGTRFFHRRWDGRVPGNAFRLPFEGLLLKEGRLDVDNPDSPQFVAENQLSSVFARWVFGRAGLETYVEYMRNDAAFDARELYVEPDHQSAYVLGAQQRVTRGPSRWLVVRTEVVNSRATHIDRVRPQGLLYAHHQLVQGHTQRGQVLGSVAVGGGGGAVLAADAYDPRGRTTVELHRIVRVVPGGEGVPTPKQMDVQYVLRGERQRFRGGVDYLWGGGVVYELNRDFRRDAVGVLATVGVRWGR